MSNNQNNKTQKSKEIPKEKRLKHALIAHIQTAKRRLKSQEYKTVDEALEYIKSSWQYDDPFPLPEGEIRRRLSSTKGMTEHYKGYFSELRELFGGKPTKNLLDETYKAIKELGYNNFQEIIKSLKEGIMDEKTLKKVIEDTTKQALGNLPEQISSSLKQSLDELKKCIEVGECRLSDTLNEKLSELLNSLNRKETKKEKKIEIKTDEPYKTIEDKIKSLTENLAESWKSNFEKFFSALGEKVLPTVENKLDNVLKTSFGHIHTTPEEAINCPTCGPLLREALKKQEEKEKQKKEEEKQKEEKITIEEEKLEAMMDKILEKKLNEIRQKQKETKEKPKKTPLEELLRM